MKKSLFFVTALLTLAVLTGCGGKQADSKVPATGLASNSVSQILESASNAVEEKRTDMDAPSESKAASEDDNGNHEGAGVSHDGIDVDLTSMSGTMVYGQVSGMMYTPEDYIGKTIRMRGQSYSSYYDETDATYYYIIIADATACCSQGLEYVLSDNAAYPQDGTEATITGVFELYNELGLTYCRLADATVTA